MFESARLKVARAEHHITDLKGQFETFVKRKPHRFGIKHNEKTGQPVIQIRFVENVPDAFAVVIGDAVHNLRCALDHMVWELVGRDKGEQNRHLQFPCKETKPDFEGACRSIQTPSKWINDMLLGFACYDGGRGHMAYVLHTLDIADKHRAIAPVLGATEHPPFQVFDAHGTVLVRMVGNRFIGYTGTMEISNVPPGGYVELEDDAQCTPGIFIKEAVLYGDAFETLLRIVHAVKIVIGTAEGEVARHTNWKS